MDQARMGTNKDTGISRDEPCSLAREQMLDWLADQARIAGQRRREGRSPPLPLLRN
ncbi:hypothetical protein GGR88_000643 [Sphingomonas jejuensis]|jgi:hypothetical protein|uniref:Uncharacterized protein n=1 Tax=Sphingomonas jejuensis TaxID=904715 RepID=A0ABX0XIW8_9SPHN|nr:hypothetical protein [Sphingomonas jejuensis]NJC33169.1 hypothetical protein [Sphingomonas jejuensis]